MWTNRRTLYASTEHVFLIVYCKHACAVWHYFMTGLQLTGSVKNPGYCSVGYNVKMFLNGKLKCVFLLELPDLPVLLCFKRFSTQVDPVGHHIFVKQIRLPGTARVQMKCTRTHTKQLCKVLAYISLELCCSLTVQLFCYLLV